MGNRLGWQNRHSCLGQSVPVLFQVLHYEANVPLICLVRPSGIREEVQLHLTLPGSKPDEMEMGQGARRLFLLQPDHPAIEGAHRVLRCRWNDQ